MIYLIEAARNLSQHASLYISKDRQLRVFRTQEAGLWSFDFEFSLAVLRRRLLSLS